MVWKISLLLIKEKKKETNSTRWLNNETLTNNSDITRETWLSCCLCAHSSTEDAVLLLTLHARTASL